MRINASYKEYMFSFIKRICNEIGPRPATSGNETKAAQETKKEFNKYCDETVVEKFECRSGGFLKVWHTREDTPERIEKNNLSKLVELDYSCR